MLSSLKNILVVAAHPDDEVLGCGGTMARLAAHGAKVTVLLLGEGPFSREGQDALARKKAAGAFADAHRAGEILGITTITPADKSFKGFPDNSFDSVPLIKIVQYIEAIGNEIMPDAVFTHNASDLNIDHRVTLQGVLTAFRPLPGAAVKSICSFEVPSSTEYGVMGTPFTPTMFINTTEYMDTKVRALQAYASEMRPWPHPRSYEGVRALAAMRGAQCGCCAAEAFSVIRIFIT